jgi:hypothetical protein
MLEDLAASGSAPSGVARSLAALLVTPEVAEIISQPAQGATPMWWSSGDMTIEFAKSAGSPMAPVAAYSGPPRPGTPGVDLRVHTLENLVVLAAGHGERVTALAFPTVAIPEPYVSKLTLPAIVLGERAIVPWIVTDARFVKCSGRRRLQITIEYFPLAVAAYPEASPTYRQVAKTVEVEQFRREYDVLGSKLFGGTAERPMRIRGHDAHGACMYGYTSNKHVTLIITATGCKCPSWACTCDA